MGSEYLPAFCTEARAFAELLSSASRTDRISGAHLVAACRTAHGRAASSDTSQKLLLDHSRFSLEDKALGNSSHVRPPRSRPVLFLFTPPHCLKKNGTRAFLPGPESQSATKDALGGPLVLTHHPQLPSQF